MCVKYVYVWWVGGGGVCRVASIQCSNLHMAQLMSNGERGTNSIFLTYGATPVRVTHGPQLC